MAVMAFNTQWLPEQGTEPYSYNYNDYYYQPQRQLQGQRLPESKLKRDGDSIFFSALCSSMHVVLHKTECWIGGHAEVERGLLEV